MREQDARTLHSLVERRGRFGHREHLELAWTYLRAYPPGEAERVMAAAIRHLAAEHGAPDKYHATMTHAWVKLVAVHRGDDDQGDFDAFLDANPGLLDRQLLTRHYSPDALWSEAARSHWTAPDLRALPA